tara:strand:- start:965 stop:2203 length:1239 start_codon:yes stop_codon:yes gene_type:complete
MSKKIFSYVLFLIGFVSITFPFTSYENAYYVKGNYYVTMVDTISDRYEPYIKDLIQSKRNISANFEKIKLANTLENNAKQLDFTLLRAKEDNDSLRILEAQSNLDAFIDKQLSEESKIDEDWSLDNLSKKALGNKIQTVKDTLSIKRFIVITTNQILNPNGLPDVKKVNIDDISIKKVNRQNKTVYIILGIISILLGVFIMLIAQDIIALHSPIIKFGSITIFFITALIYIYKINSSLQNDIKFDRIFTERENVVKEHLLKLSDLQVTHFKEKGEYAENWKQLINFAKFDSVQIIKFLVNKNDTNAVNQAINTGKSLEDTIYLPVYEKIYGTENNIFLDSICFVPYSPDTFIIKTGYVERNEKEIKVMLIQTDKSVFVKNLKIFPDNFNNFVARKPVLSVGSLNEPTTEGNW